MTALDDIKVHVKIKISALWVSVMFCYGDHPDHGVAAHPSATPQ